jgi:hypothetical protein
MSGTERQTPVADRWMLLIHQLPAKPAYLRVKIWRRLQALGAVTVKNSVYVLPANTETQEDFEWLLREITEGGGEAMICEARLVDGLTDQEVRALFDAARDADYEALATEARPLMKRLTKAASSETLAEAKVQLARFKARLAQIVAIDFFGANGRETVDGLLGGIEAKIAESEPPESADVPAAAAKNVDDLKGRVWVTRQGVHVDRIASAWLIRRFIDPQARFKFVPPRGYAPEPNELRFDMFNAEFTHEGDRCTFEVLLARTHLEDPALRAIAEIVHDIDLKDAKFARSQVDGIKTLITAICMATHNDEERIVRGSAVFDDLHQYFRKIRE